MIDLSGKVALVTGGSKNIGKAIAITLAQASAKVIITYNQDEESAQHTLMQHDNIIAMTQWDVTNPNWDGLKGIVYDFGGLDILVCNAGINIPAPFNEIDFMDWQAVLDVNLTGQFKTVRALLPLVHDGGSVVFIGSVSGHIGGKVSSHYCVSKAGVSALAANVGLFAAPRGIRVNCVAPGYVRSPLTDKGAENQIVRDTIKSIPMGRLAEPDEIASVVLFMVSDLATYITAQTIHVNGGLYF